MTRVGVDLIEIGRIREALERYARLPRPLLHRGRAGVLRRAPNPAQHYAARFAGKEAVGKALGLGVARLFTWREIEIAGRPKPAVTLSGRVERGPSASGPGAIDLSMTHSRELASAVCVVADTRMLEPLYTAAEMRAAEEGHDVEELMQRAGARGRRAKCCARFPEARSFAAVCGGGANGGDGRIAAELLRAAGWEERALGEADVVIDALFGTGFTAAAAREAAAQIRAMNGPARPVVAVDIPSGVDASTGEVPGEAVEADVTVTFHGRKVGPRGRAGRFRAGEVVVADIGLEHRTTEHARVLPRSSGWFRAGGRETTKYTAGSVLVVGGSPGLTGRRLPHGGGGVSRRRRLRRRRGAAGVAAGDRDAPAARR